MRHSSKIRMPRSHLPLRKIRSKRNLLMVGLTGKNCVKRFSLCLLGSLPWAVAVLPLQAQTLTVRVVESSETRNTVMEEMPVIRFGSERAAQLTITVDDALRYQTIEGFGASLT